MKKIILFLLFVFIVVSCTDTNAPISSNSFNGRWKCTESNSLTGSTTYIVTLERNAKDTTHYMVRNFFNAGENQLIVFKQNADSTLQLIQQPTSAHIIRTFEGSCVPYSALQMKYTLYDGEKDVFFEAVFSRN